MSYDTTVREALEPPEPRTRATDPSVPRALRRRARRWWMPVAVATLALSVLGGATWVVGRFAPSHTGQEFDEFQSPHSPLSGPLEDDSVQLHRRP